MKNTAQPAEAATGPARFKVGDLIEYTNPDSGEVFYGRIVIPYTEGRVFDEAGRFLSVQQGYGCMYAGYGHDSVGRPYFAHASGLRLLKHPELVAARQDEAFQQFKAGLLAKPKRVRRSKRATA